MQKQVCVVRPRSHDVALVVDKAHGVDVVAVALRHRRRRLARHVEEDQAWQARARDDVRGGGGPCERPDAGAAAERARDEVQSLVDLLQSFDRQINKPQPVCSLSIQWCAA